MSLPTVLLKVPFTWMIKFHRVTPYSICLKMLPLHPDSGSWLNMNTSLLAQSHNTPLLPPKILHNHCLQVLLGHEDVLREIKNNAYANFWGVKQVCYGICASSELPQ